MKGVQCYELFGGIALKYHAFFPLQIDKIVEMIEDYDELDDMEVSIMFVSTRGSFLAFL